MQRFSFVRHVSCTSCNVFYSVNVVFPRRDCFADFFLDYVHCPPRVQWAAEELRRDPRFDCRFVE